MNAFVPCHSSTPKSVSKLSVMVYYGILQSIRRLQALDVGLRRARGERERCFAGVEMGEMRDLVGKE